MTVVKSIIYPFQIGSKIYEAYRDLCQKSISETYTPNEEYCFLDFSGLFISKVEVLSINPLVIYFHDVLSDEAVSQVIQDATPNLEVPKTVSPKDRSVKSASSNRSGKVAFVSDQGHTKVSKKYVVVVPCTLQRKFST